MYEKSIPQSMVGSHGHSQSLLKGTQIYYYYFMWMGALPACVSVRYVCAVPMGAR